MPTKSSSGSTILVIVLLVLTFPLWIALGGVLIGVLGGLLGALFGVVAALFAGMIALIALPIKVLFGWGDVSCTWPNIFSGLHGNPYVWLALLIVAALIISRRNRK